MKKRYEILEGLPPYGAMPKVIPVNELFYSVGFVVRFYKEDGGDWVANFIPGWTNQSSIHELENPSHLLVIANGAGYVLDCEKEKEITSLGPTIKFILETEKRQIVLSNDLEIIVIENGEVWRTKRISWDGIEDIILERGALKGKCHFPLSVNEEWMPFTLNLGTREVSGGSYDESTFKPLSESTIPSDKRWWQFWK